MCATGQLQNVLVGLRLTKAWNVGNRSRTSNQQSRSCDFILSVVRVAAIMSRMSPLARWLSGVGAVVFGSCKANRPLPTEQPLTGNISTLKIVSSIHVVETTNPISQFRVCSSSSRLNALTFTVVLQEFSKRRAAWTAPPLKATSGVLYKYIKTVSNASTGCMTDL